MGLLDNPPKLLECYIYLTVCHFQMKNMEKSRDFYNEIKRLKLEDYMKAIDPPDKLRDKYLEIVSYFSRYESQTVLPTPSPPGSTAILPAETYRPGRGNLQAEAEQLRDAIKSNRKNIDAYLRLSAVCVEQRKYKDARKALEDLLKVDSRNGNAYFELGRVYLIEHKEKKALESFEKAAVFLPDNLELHYELGKLYFDLKSYEKAKLEFAEVRKTSATYKDTEKYLASLEELGKKKR